MTSKAWKVLITCDDDHNDHDVDDDEDKDEELSDNVDNIHWICGDNDFDSIKGRFCLSRKMITFSSCVKANWQINIVMDVPKISFCADFGFRKSENMK